MLMPETRRYCAIFLPMLSADRWLLEQGESVSALTPLAFIQKVAGAMRIIAVNEVALALGLTPNMMLADARARVPDLINVDHDPAADALLLAHIADDCDRYTPMVALDPPDGLILDISGCAHLWDGETELVSALAARLAHHGFTLRLALAETPDKARALARHGGELLRVERRTPPGMLQEERAGYVSPLPIAALDLSEEQSTALRRAGLYTVDDLATRPRAPLAARFGKTIVSKLARVLGEEDIRITPRRVPPALFLIHRFAEPAARTDHILATVQALSEEAEIELRARGQGGRCFALSLFRSDGDTRRLTIETGSPTRDPALLMRLFRERIDTLSDPLDPGFGYDAVRLDVTLSENLGAAQIGIDGESGGEIAQSQALNALLDQIGVRLGQNRVRRMACGNSHIPELAAFTTPASAPTLPLPWPECEVGEPPLRPLHLFDPPQRVEVIAEVPDGPPRRFRWRRQMHDVVAHEGPERIASEWWRRRDMRGLTRDYFRVEDSQGRRFWLFRHGLYGAEKVSPDWYLHGLFA
jgi:protein ImuB